jgi:hypothetical protein
LHAEVEAQWAGQIGRRQLAVLRTTMADLIEGIAG